jgi:hypothetical protein
MSLTPTSKAPRPTWQFARSNPPLAASTWNWRAPICQWRRSLCNSRTSICRGHGPLCLRRPSLCCLDPELPFGDALAFETLFRRCTRAKRASLSRHRNRVSPTTAFPNGSLGTREILQGFGQQHGLTAIHSCDVTHGGASYRDPPRRRRVYTQSQSLGTSQNRL